MNSLMLNADTPTRPLHARSIGTQEFVTNYLQYPGMITFELK